MDNNEQAVAVAEDGVIVVDEAGQAIEAGQPVQVITGDVDNGNSPDQPNGEDQVSTDSAASDVEVTEAEA